MARYFFDFYDGEVRRDHHGTECVGYDDIRREVMHTLPEVAKGIIPTNGDQQAFTVSVRNDRNITVYSATLTFSSVWMGEDVPPVEELIE